MTRFLKFACLWVAACSLAFLAPAQVLMHRRKAFRTAPGAWLLSETFEGTGYSGTAWTEAGTPNEDYTTTVLSGSQSFSSTGTFQSAYVSFTGQTTVYAYCLLRRKVQSAQTDNTVFAIQNAAGTVTLAGLGQNYSSNNTQFKLRCNGVFSTASATTQGSANTTTYHVWLTYVSGGTCELAMSTTGTKPTATGTGLVFIQATGASDTAALVKLVLSDTDGSWTADNVIVSTTAIGDNPTP